MQKKYIIIVLVMLGFALEGIAKSINTYGFTIGAGQTREFYINMNTTRNNLISFQIDLKMPAGLTVNVDQCGLAGHVTDKEQALFVGKLEDNLYRLMSTSFHLTPMTMEEAPLVKISVTADDTFKGGTINLVDMFTINDTGTKVVWISDACEVPLGKVIRGDVNYDGVVSVTDLTELVDFILGKEKLYKSAYDVSGNGVVEVSDVSTLTDLLMGK